MSPLVADQASAVIHTYNLNRQCFVVRPNAAMQLVNMIDDRPKNQSERATRNDLYDGPTEHAQCVITQIAVNSTKTVTPKPLTHGQRLLSSSYSMG